MKIIIAPRETYARRIAEDGSILPPATTGRKAEEDQ